MPSIDMQIAPCGTVAASSQGALPQRQANGNNCSRRATAPMSYYIFRTDKAKLPFRNICQVAMQSNDMHSAPCCTVPASSQGALPQNKQMATAAAGARLHQCHTTYSERIERMCHSGMFLKLQCKALTCTAPLVAQLLLANKGNPLKQANGNNYSRRATAPMSYCIFSTDSAKLPLRNISQVAMQSIDMNSDP
jgi:hypothetical protein